MHLKQVVLLLLRLTLKKCIVNDSFPQSKTLPKKVSSSTQTNRRPAFYIDGFSNEPEAIKYFAGLDNIHMFNLVLSSLGPASYELTYINGAVAEDMVNVRDQLFLTLIKLRLHKAKIELSMMFDVAEESVSNIVLTWARFMALQWGELDTWPSKDLLRCHSPVDFKQTYPTTRVIVDVLECPVRRPTDSESQHLTFSRENVLSNVS